MEATNKHHLGPAATGCRGMKLEFVSPYWQISDWPCLLSLIKKDPLPVRSEKRQPFRQAEIFPLVTRVVGPFEERWQVPLSCMTRLAFLMGSGLRMREKKAQVWASYVARYAEENAQFAALSTRGSRSPSLTRRRRVYPLVLLDPTLPGILES